jgi:hypothetical protein
MLDDAWAAGTTVVVRVLADVRADQRWKWEGTRRDIRQALN